MRFYGVISPKKLDFSDLYFKSISQWGAHLDFYVIDRGSLVVIFQVI